jgi:hypothetical protein
MADDLNKTDEAQRIEQIEAQATALQGQLAGAATPDAIKNILDSLQNLRLAVPAGAIMPANLGTAIASAQIAYDVAVAEDALPAASFVPTLSAAFSKAVFNLMSREEQDYFNSFRHGEKYDVYEVGDDGKIKRDEHGAPVKKEIDGGKMQENLTRIKYHSLDDKQKESIPDKPPETQEELEKLKESLKEVEGRKAAEIQEKVEKGEMPQKDADKKIAENREAFKDAQRKVDEVIKEEKMAENSPPHMKPMGDALLKEAKKDMRDALKKSVLDEAVLEKEKPVFAKEHNPAEAFDHGLASAPVRKTDKERVLS